MKEKNKKQMDCIRCGKCCKRGACAIAPDEIPKIANFLNITPKELMKKYLLRKWAFDENGNEFYYFAFSNKILTPRKYFFPFLEKYLNHDGKIRLKKKIGKEWAKHECLCLRFIKGRAECIINSVKPYSAKEFKCWEYTDENFEALSIKDSDIILNIAKQWDKKHKYSWINKPEYCIDCEAKRCPLDYNIEACKLNKLKT